MFFEFFETLRNKPKEVRKRYAFLISFTATAVVVLVWVAGILLTNFGSRDLQKNTPQKEEEVTTKTLFDQSNTFLQDATQGVVEGNNKEESDVDTAQMGEN